MSAGSAAIISPRNSGKNRRASGWARHWEETPEQASASLQRYRSEAIDVIDAVGVPRTAPGWENLPRLEDREHLGELEAARTSLEHDVARVLLQLEQARSEMHSAEHRAQALGAALESVTARVAALESSRTWRWTRPARDLAALASRLFRKRSRP